MLLIGQNQIYATFFYCKNKFDVKNRRFTTDNLHLFTVIKLNFADHYRYCYCFLLYYYDAFRNFNCAYR